MADNVIVRVPEQQFIRGEDGYSPVVTVEDIEHGHRVTITDREHPVEGQSFDVMDGASAYEQAADGGYSGTEAEFNEELANFKEYAQQANYARSDAITAANTAGSYSSQARQAVNQAQSAMNGAQRAASSASESATSASGSETAAANSATAAGNAQTAAEDAQEAAETAQAAAESARDTAITTLQTEGAAQKTAIQQKGAEVIASIPSDYTDLTEDVSDLKSAVNDSVLYGNQPLGALLKNKYIGPTLGNLENYVGWSATEFVPVVNTNVLIINSPAGDSEGNYNVFYDSGKTLIPNSSFRFNVGETSINVPSNAAYYRMSAPTATMEQVTVKWWVANQLDNVVEGNQLTDPITALKRHTNMNGLDGNANANHNDCFCLAHISDIHLDGKRFKRFGQFCDAHPEINARICTGDFGNWPGYQYNGETQEAYMRGIETPHKTLFTVGNHERNGGTYNGVQYGFTKEQVFENWSLAQWYEDTGVTVASGSLYYYKDYNTSRYKIRLIVLNCCDADGTSGAVLFYSQEQIDWLISLLGSTSDDTAVIIATHFAESRVRSNDKGFYTRETYTGTEYANTPVIENIIDAWRNGTSYIATNVYVRQVINHTINVNADFTGQHGHFLAWLSGHMHRDRIGYSLAHPDQLILSIVNGVTSRDEFSPDITLDMSNCSDLPRIAGKASEDGFNLYAFDPVNDIVKVMRIGSSVNDEMIIRKVACFSTLGEIEEINYETIIDHVTGKKSFQPGLVAELADGTTHEVYRGYTIKGSNKIVETWAKMTIGKDTALGTGTNWAYIQADDLPKVDDYRGEMDADIVPVASYNIIYPEILPRWPFAVTGYYDANTTYPDKNWIYFRANGTGNVTDWLASNTVTVLYQLKTPAVYTLA